MENFYKWIQEFADGSLPAIVLGVFGGFVRLMSGDKLVGFRYAVGSLLLSMFASIMVNALCMELKITGNYWAVTIGFTGLCSRMVVEKLERKFLKTIDDMGK